MSSCNEDDEIVRLKVLLSDQCNRIDWVNGSAAVRCKNKADLYRIYNGTEILVCKECLEFAMQGNGITFAVQYYNESFRVSYLLIKDPNFNREFLPILE